MIIKQIEGEHKLKTGLLLRLVALVRRRNKQTSNFLKDKGP